VTFIARERHAGLQAANEGWGLGEAEQGGDRGGEGVEHGGPWFESRIAH